MKTLLLLQSSLCGCLYLYHFNFKGTYNFDFKINKVPGENTNIFSSKKIKVAVLLPRDIMYKKSHLRTIKMKYAYVR